MIMAVERIERLCTLVFTRHEVKSFMWHHSTRVTITTRRRHIHCNMTTIDWADTDTFNAHFHTEEFEPHILADYGAVLKHHFAPGPFRRQHCPCNKPVCAAGPECSFYRFPCHDKMAYTLTNCTEFGHADEARLVHNERLVHVEPYEFKPPIGPLLEQIEHAH